LRRSMDNRKHALAGPDSALDRRLGPQLACAAMAKRCRFRSGFMTRALASACPAPSPSSIAKHLPSW
jgi:hypothetical protein